MPLHDYLEGFLAWPDSSRRPNVPVGPDSSGHPIADSGYPLGVPVGPDSSGHPPAGCAWPAIFLAVALGAAGEPAWAADPLGRLFTTAQQRTQFDELRQALPQGEESARVDLREEGDESATPEKPSGESITIKGLVTRKGGHSTAWVNGSNTFEGDVASQYLHIESKDIHPRGVDITVPDLEAPVRVKVGESYDPATNRIVDLASENGSQESEEGPSGPEPDTDSDATAPAQR